MKPTCSNRALLLFILAALAPTQCYELKVNLFGPDGTGIERSLHGTIHQLASP